MLAGYRDEEIAQPPPPSDRRKPPMTTRKTLRPSYKDCGKPHHFRQRSGKRPLVARSGAGDAEAAQDKLSQYRTGNRRTGYRLCESQPEQAKAQLAQVCSLMVTPRYRACQRNLLTRAVEPQYAERAGSTVLTFPLTRPVRVRAYVDERNLSQTQPRDILLYTDGRPDKPYHGKIGFVSPTANLRRKTVETPICVPICSSPAHRVTDADDALRGMPVTVKFNDEARHEEAVITHGLTKRFAEWINQRRAARLYPFIPVMSPGLGHGAGKPR